jgi:hypothetical protein
MLIPSQAALVLATALTAFRLFVIPPEGGMEPASMQATAAFHLQGDGR